MKSFMELNESVSDELSDMFFTLTSSLAVLAQKIRSYHQNVIGKNFFPLHQELNDQYEKIDSLVDDSAELIRQINKAPAPNSMKAMLDYSLILEESDRKLVTSEYFSPIIVADYKTINQFCNEIILMADSAQQQELSDFAITIRTKLNKYIWKLESGTI